MESPCKRSKSISYGGMIHIRYKGRSWMTSSQPADTDSPCIFSCKIKTGDACHASCKKSIYKMTSYGGIIRIRLRVEGASFLSACQHKLPCIYLVVLYIIGF